MEKDRTYGCQFYASSPKRMLHIFDVFEFEEITGNQRGLCTPDFDIDLHSEYGWGIYFQISHNGQEIDIRVDEDASNHWNFCDLLDSVSQAYIGFPEDRIYSQYGDYNDGWMSKGHTRSVFRGANQFITTDLFVERIFVKLLVRNDPDLNYEDNWFYDKETPFDFFCDYNQKTLEELKQPVLLAVQMTHRLFVSTIYHAVLRMIKAIGFDGYKEIFGDEFPHRLLRKLELIVMLFTIEEDGYYDRNHSIYEGNYPKLDRESLSIPSRRVYTIDELASRGRHFKMNDENSDAP